MVMTSGKFWRGSQGSEGKSLESEIAKNVTVHRLEV